MFSKNCGPEGVGNFCDKISKMRITVIAKPGAREEKIQKISETEYRVWVKEPAKEGRANWAIERALAQHFGVAVSRVRIISGHTSRRKIVEIL